MPFDSLPFDSMFASGNTHNLGLRTSAGSEATSVPYHKCYARTWLVTLRPWLRHRAGGGSWQYGVQSQLGCISSAFHHRAHIPNTTLG